MKKITIIISILLIGWMSGGGQSYVRLADQSGYIMPSETNTELELLAAELVNALPAEFRDDFKVYDFGYYVINEFMVGQNQEPAIWSSVVKDAENRSPYYLLFGREFNQNGIFNTIRLDMKLPSTGMFSCLDNSYYSIIFNSLAEYAQLATSFIGSQSGFLSASVFAEREAMKKLKGHLNKLSTCCQNGVWSPSCGNCRYSPYEVESYFRSKGYMLLTIGDGIVISDNIYTNISSKKKISFVAHGEMINFTDDLNTFAAEFGATIRVTEFNGTNCDSLTQISPISPTGTYVEDIVVINYGGYKAVLTNIQIDKSARFVPLWIVVEVLKRLGTATIAATVEIGVNVLLEWWIGDHGSFMDAWDAADIDWIDVFGAFAEGAISEAKYASFIITALRPVVKWIINTPYSSYYNGGGSGTRGVGWIAELGKQIVNAFATTAMEEFVLKKVKVIEKVAKKYSGSLSNQMKNKIPKIAEAIASKKPKLIIRWKELAQLLPSFNSNSELLEDPQYLEKVLDAMKIPKWKIKGQKLGYTGSGSRLAENIKYVTGKAKPANYHAHHIVPKGATKPESAVQVQNLLKSNGIDVNEAVNGVYLPKSAKYVKNAETPHANVHTTDYYNALLRDLRTLNGQPNAIREKLQEIAKKLENGSYDY